MPDVARNTLLSVLVRSGGKVRIGGQYWDAIVWATGAWHHYLYTGDKHFLALALEATKNSLDYFEQTEFDAADNLFRGPGWSDGVAAYPDEYADAGGSSGILDWPKHNPDKMSKPGYGIPMKALSTNCLYYNAYVTAEKMAVELKAPVDPQWKTKAARLKRAINADLWNDEKGNYRFLVGPFGKCDLQEGLGSSYALLFGIADPKQAEAVFASQHVTPAGLPCGWPNLRRYETPDGMSFGRHIGTVWPQIQGFWAEAAARAGKPEVFGHELFNLAAHASTGQAVCRNLPPHHRQDLRRLAGERKAGHHPVAGDFPSDLGGHGLPPHDSPGPCRNAIRRRWRSLPTVRSQGDFACRVAERELPQHESRPDDSGDWNHGQAMPHQRAGGEGRTAERRR